MTSLKIDLAPDEAAALERVRKHHRGGVLSLESAARLLIRDELIRMGLLGLPDANRSKAARKSPR